MRFFLFNIDYIIEFFPLWIILRTKLLEINYYHQIIIYIYICFHSFILSIYIYITYGSRVTIMNIFIFNIAQALMW